MHPCVLISHLVAKLLLIHIQGFPLADAHPPSTTSAQFLDQVPARSAVYGRAIPPEPSGMIEHRIHDPTPRNVHIGGDDYISDHATPFPFVRHDAEFTACIEQQFSFQALKPAYSTRQHCAHHHSNRTPISFWSNSMQFFRTPIGTVAATTQRANRSTAERLIAFQFEVSDQAGAA